MPRAPGRRVVGRRVRSLLRAARGCPGAWLVEAVVTGEAAEGSGRGNLGSGLVGDVAVSIEIGSMGSSSQHDPVSASGKLALVNLVANFLFSGFVILGCGFQIC